MVSPGAMAVAAIVASLIGPTARTTFPELIAWEPAEVVSVKVANAPPRTAPVPATTTARVRATRLAVARREPSGVLPLSMICVLQEIVGGEPLCFSVF
jgi:hypothetical protein